MSSQKTSVTGFLGLDIGSVSAKLVALFSDPSGVRLQDHISPDSGYSILSASNGSCLVLSGCAPTHGDLLNTAEHMLRNFKEFLPGARILGASVTGCGGRSLAQQLGGTYVNDFHALAEGTAFLHPEVATILEMGGDSSRYLSIATDDNAGSVVIMDYAQNGDCAAGTGSFLDQQASRLLYKVEDIGDLVLETPRAANIAGRCSVFAKSDMIHAQQRGFQPPEILKGLCQAVVRNFKGTLIHGRTLQPRVAFVGGMAKNRGVAEALRQLLNLDDGNFLTPAFPAHLAAIGCAVIASKTPRQGEHFTASKPSPKTEEQSQDYDAALPLSRDRVLALRHLGATHKIDTQSKPIDTYLGLDIGSVSTNLALLDQGGNVIKEIYTKTNARPIEVVSECLQQVGKEFGDRISICGVGTTGSGRELVGELVGADTINDEITAHTTGANFIADRFGLTRPDTIFEIGGQDSKFISISDGVVVDFAMNEACAAGTGSFLEEQAERLNVNIIDEFAQLAFSARRPLRLGERCTVFMEKDVGSYLRHNVSKANIAAGLAYSVAHNYINRVVRSRRIGDAIFFQGGTAYNDAVAAALAQILEKQVTVPPHNGIIGAIGMALLAKEKITASGGRTVFRGLDFQTSNLNVRHFTCKGCSNFCQMQEYKIAGEKSYWGDKCSERYRKRKRAEYEPQLPDIFGLYDKLLHRESPHLDGAGIRIGIPRAMYFHEQLPFWRTYFQALGTTVVLSEVTNRQIIDAGIESTVAEPCFPVVVAHGHVGDLLGRNLDFVFLPNIINAKRTPDSEECYLCPWGQTLPFVVRSSPAFEKDKNRFLCPTLRFADGIDSVKKVMREVAHRLGISEHKSDKAIELAHGAQQAFVRDFRQACGPAIEDHLRGNRPAIVIVGRPYNIYDSAINLDIGRKLRALYGIDAIPMDALCTDDISIADIHPNMFWNYGQRILRTAKFASSWPNLNIIYVTNFKCGPDSYVKHYVDRALGKPFLTLQFDGHNNDAGVLTRCEAFLDSIGFLRRWRGIGARHTRTKTWTTETANR